MVNIKYIPALLAIVPAGGITAASKQLGISKALLSRIVRQAKTEAGEPIFQMKGRRLVLTTAGEIYLDAAREIMNIDRGIRARIEDSKEKGSGLFRLGVSDQKTLRLIPEVMPDFISQYPQVTLHLLEAESDQLEQMLLDGLCDAAFIAAASTHRDLNYQPIEAEQLVLLANAETQLAQRFPDGSELDITEAKDEQFICLSPGTSLRDMQDELFAKHDMAPDILLETGNIEMIMAITAQSNAVSILSDAYISERMLDRSHVKVFPISGTSYNKKLYLCYKKGMYLKKYQVDFIRMICSRLQVPPR